LQRDGVCAQIIQPFCAYGLGKSWRNCVHLCSDLKGIQSGQHRMPFKVEKLAIGYCVVIFRGL
ncbi:MAG: hypothetical protein PVJ56_15250, partial [Desulfobacterales bacterium]